MGSMSLSETSILGVWFVISYETILCFFLGWQILDVWLFLCDILNVFFWYSEYVNKFLIHCQAIENIVPELSQIIE